MDWPRFIAALATVCAWAHAHAECAPVEILDPVKNSTIHGARPDIRWVGLDARFASRFVALIREIFQMSEASHLFSKRKDLLSLICALLALVWFNSAFAETSLPEESTWAWIHSGPLFDKWAVVTGKGKVKIKDG